MNVPLYGDEYRKVFGNMATLYPKAQDNPNMSIKISAGGFWAYSSGAIYVEFIGGSSPDIIAPLANAKWVAVCINVGGRIINVDGESGANPNLPVIPSNLFPISLVYVQQGMTKITNDNVFDARPIFSLMVRNHNILEGRSEENAHPITSITNLEGELNNRVTLSQLENALLDKADIDGTSAEKFVMNHDYTGVPGADIIFEVERGAESNVSIKWNETTNCWQFTNDGTNFHNLFSNTGIADLMIKTYSQNEEPALDTNNKAAFWIDTNDSNKVYLVFRRADEDQVKIQLT